MIPTAILHKFDRLAILVNMIIEAHLPCNNNISHSAQVVCTEYAAHLNNIIFLLLYSSIIKPARNGFHTDSFQISQQSGGGGGGDWE